MLVPKVFIRCARINIRKKVKHKLFAIMRIVMFAKLANVDIWEEIEIFAKSN